MCGSGVMVSSEKRQTYLHRTPLSLSEATGWRAIYILEPDDDDLWTDEPLLAWCVFHHEERPVAGATGSAVDHGNHIEGVVHSGTDLGSYPDSAQNVGNFWHYRRIDDPDPTRDEARAEQARRERRKR